MSRLHYLNFHFTRFSSNKKCEGKIKM